MAVCDNGNGGTTKLELERRDLLKLAAFVLSILAGVLGAVVPLSMYIFQSRSEAIVEHAAIELRAALHEQEARIKRETSEEKAKTVEKAVADTKLMVQTVHANQKAFMFDMGVRRAKPIPASVSFEELGLDEPNSSEEPQ